MWCRLTHFRKLLSNTWVKKKQVSLEIDSHLSPYQWPENLRTSPVACKSIRLSSSVEASDRVQNNGVWDKEASRLMLKVPVTTVSPEGVTWLGREGRPVLGTWLWSEKYLSCVEDGVENAQWLASILNDFTDFFFPFLVFALLIDDYFSHCSLQLYSHTFTFIIYISWTRRRIRARLPCKLGLVPVPSSSWLWSY